MSRKELYVWEKDMTDSMKVLLTDVETLSVMEHYYQESKEG